MARIVIVGASEAGRTQINRLLASSGFEVFRVCASGSELRRVLNTCEDGIVILAGGITDCLPDDLVGDFGDSFQFLMIARPEALAACESPRLFKLTYPCAGNAVLGAIEILSPFHAQHLPKRSGEDRALVDRAKVQLMRTRGITEPQAHRHMQQHAMTHGMKMTEYAKQLLKNSEGTEEL